MRSNRGRSARLALAALTLLAVACADDPVPGPGSLEAAVVSPNGDEGAAVLLLLGDGVDAVAGLGDTEVYASTSTSESRTRVVLLHPTGGRLTFRVDVSDVTQPPAWAFEEVAGPDDELRTDVSGYSVEFVR